MNQGVIGRERAGERVVFAESRYRWRTEDVTGGEVALKLAEILLLMIYCIHNLVGQEART